MKNQAMAVLFVGLTACGGAALRVGTIGDAERTRASLAGHDAQALAPQAFAEADQALAAAKDAETRGDKTAAELQAERAVAAYQSAIAIARLSRATDEAAAANEALSRAVEQSTRYAAARKASEREVDDLEKQLRIAREAAHPASSGPADPARERARLVAAQSLAAQARLLCSAARLVSPEAPGLAEAENAAAELDKKLAGSPTPAPIDLAGRTRAGCLGALTKARRSGAPDTDPSDALLGELSRARVIEGAADPKAKSARDLAPSRDERGVVVTLRSIFADNGLSPDGKTVVEELGRVAAAHPEFSVQVVLHDATPPSSGDVARNDKRGDAMAKALAAGGADPKKIKVEQLGTRAPVFDPADTKRRADNARVEIVFVGRN